MFKILKLKLKHANATSLTFKRYKHPPSHWSVVRKNKTVVNKALDHFEEFYGSTFGERWPDIKKAITRPNKYVAVVNNFGDDWETMEHLEKLGALNLKDVYEERKEIYKYKSSGLAKISKNENSDIDSKISKLAQQLSEEELKELYGDSENIPPNILDTKFNEIQQMENEEDLTEEVDEERLEKVQCSSGKNITDETYGYDESRLIHPDLGLSSLALSSFIPTSKLKGKEDWMPESYQFQQYLSVRDFPVNTEEDESFEIPQHLNVYSFDVANKTKFFEPKVGKTGVYNYYLMDGASVLPTIALNPQPGDRILDMCASPGGKTLLLLQTMMPGIVIANDLQQSRLNRIHKVLGEYLYDYKISDVWRDRVIVTKSDGKTVHDDHGFDKILVDAPCTSDRLSAREVDDNIFKSSRIKERLKLPDKQRDLLCNALKLCKIGGRVVYSTCTLSPLQNDGVVQAALKKAHQLHKIEATVKLFTNSILPLRGLFRLGEGSLAAKYGHLVVPHVNSNFGPGYFATIVRNK